MSKGTPGVRYAEVDRETRETKIQVVLDMDGGNRSDVSTGLPILDHMLRKMAFHGMLDLGVSVDGDLAVDDHHTVEDTGIVIGQAIHLALVDSPGICRFGSVQLPMDDALVLVAIDIGGRGYLGWDMPFERESIGGMSTENVREFFAAVAFNAGMSVHIRKIAGHNDRHLCEAAFKAFGIALNQASRRTERKGPNSTKGQVRS